MRARAQRHALQNNNWAAENRTARVCPGKGSLLLKPTLTLYKALLQDTPGATTAEVQRARWARVQYTRTAFSAAWETKIQHRQGEDTQGDGTGTAMEMERCRPAQRHRARDREGRAQGETSSDVIRCTGRG